MPRPSVQFSKPNSEEVGEERRIGSGQGIDPVAASVLGEAAVRNRLAGLVVERRIAVVVEHHIEVGGVEPRMAAAVERHTADHTVVVVVRRNLPAEVADHPTCWTSRPWYRRKDR